MKKGFLLFVLLIGTVAFLKAQVYKTSAGLFLDVGNGGTYVGPSIKHYMDRQSALQGMIIFGNGSTIIGGEYSYNKRIPNAKGLVWNIGVGPQLAFGHGNTDVLVRPMLGLEYKVINVPIDFGFDWRPSWTVTHGSNFEAGRFGIAFKYVIH